ncbi:MAG: OprD family outer membrane porin [Sulfurimonadaceae bacterium]
MKLVKMSLLAATLIASSAFAIDNVKVSGDAKLYYSTNDAEILDGASGEEISGLFAQPSSAGQAALGLGLTADLTEGISAGLHMTAISTLGLENNLVANVWEGGLTDEFWFDEAWLAGTVGKTTGKIGRMTLDTPLVFTETWSIAKNTFEAAVLLNQDISDTTLVAAYVGASNGSETQGGFGLGSVTASWDGSQNSNFASFYDGAYAFGAVNNSWKPLTVQAWYYQVQHIASAYWLQADYASDFGLTLGAQYTGVDLADALAPTGDKGNTALALMAGYEMKDTFTVSAAYSQTDKNDNDLGAGFNVAASGQSKLYTEAWWNYGYITQQDTSAFNVTATTPEELTWAQLGLYLTQSTGKDGVAVGTDLEMTEVTLSASKSFGPLDTSLVYIMTDATDQNIKAGDTEGSAYNTVQAYLTYNF